MEDSFLQESCFRLMTERGEMMQDKFRALRLPAAAFTGYDDALVVLVLQHAVVGGIGHGEDVRGKVVEFAVLVGFDVLWVVEGKILEGIHGYQYATHIPASKKGSCVEE